MPTNETWHPCPSWAGYEASDNGRIRRSTAGRLTEAGRVIGCNVKNRYAMVSVKVDGKFTSVPIHWLVTDAFFGPRPSGLVTNHMDGNKHNNAPANLEYVTQRENYHHAIRTGLQKKHGEHCNFSVLNEEQVRGIHALFESGVSLLEVASAYGISKTHVLDIATGKVWHHLGLPPIRRRTLTEVVMAHLRRCGSIKMDDLGGIVESEPRLRSYGSTDSKSVGYRVVRRLLESGQIVRLRQGVYAPAIPGAG